MPVHRLLVIDDEAPVRRFFERTLTHFHYRVDVAESGREGLALYKQGAYDVVLTDLNMPGIDGLEVLAQLKQIDETAAVVVITGYGSIHSAVEAMKAGAIDYLTKPVDVEALLITINRIIENRQNLERLRHLEEQVVKQNSFEGLVGVSLEMQGIYSLIRRVAKSETTVLIQGETGTGKELVAKAVHNLSGVDGFLPINCGALPDDILESELFGHEKGAFTGAIRRKYGLIEQAAGGTLFLDEIEEMSSALQVKLLRAIQEREVLPVGGDHPIPVQFRLIAASSTNLRELLDAGSFRADLFYRLSVMVIDLPPLRRRSGDVPLLAKYFLRQVADRMGISSPEFSPEAMMLLTTHNWPGNVRELENAIEQALILSEGKSVGMEHLPEDLIASNGEADDWIFSNLEFREARKQFEKKYLESILERADGVVAEAARFAGMNRQHLYAKMKALGISLNG